MEFGPTTAAAIPPTRSYPHRVIWDSEPIAPILYLEAFRCPIEVSLDVLQQLLNITDNRRLQVVYERQNVILRITGVHQHVATKGVDAFLDSSVQISARTCLSTEDIRCGGLSRTLQISAHLGSGGSCFAVTRIREMRLQSRQLLTGDWGYLLMDSAHRLSLENSNERVFDHFAATMPLPAVGIWRKRSDALGHSDDSILRDPLFLQQLDAFATQYAFNFGRHEETPFLILLMSTNIVGFPECSSPSLFECKRTVNSGGLSSSCSLRVSVVRKAPTHSSTTILGAHGDGAHYVDESGVLWNPCSATAQPSEDSLKGLHGACLLDKDRVWTAHVGFLNSILAAESAPAEHSEQEPMPTVLNETLSSSFFTQATAISELRRDLERFTAETVTESVVSRGLNTETHGASSAVDLAAASLGTKRAEVPLAATHAAWLPHSLAFQGLAVQAAEAPMLRTYPEEPMIASGDFPVPMPPPPQSSVHSCCSSQNENRSLAQQDTEEKFKEASLSSSCSVSSLGSMQCAPVRQTDSRWMTDPEVSYRGHLMRMPIDADLFCL